MNDFDDRTFGRTPDSMDENIVDETLGDENQGEFRDDSGMPRVSDDRDLEPQGSGVDETPWRREYSSLALRSDLARKFEDLVVSVRDWSRREGSDAARALAADLEVLYGRIGQPAEDTDRALDESDMDTLDAPA